jgi:hypothetical protein
MVQNGSFWFLESLLLSGSVVFGESRAPVLPPCGATIVCHLSARVDTIGALAGLLPNTFSSSTIILLFNLGTN